MQQRVCEGAGDKVLLSDLDPSTLSDLDSAAGISLPVVGYKVMQFSPEKNWHCNTVRAYQAITWIYD